MNSLLDVAWVLFQDPDPETTVHRVDLRTGKVACAEWISHNAGTRISDKDASKYGPRCTTCWPADGRATA